MIFVYTRKYYHFYPNPCMQNLKTIIFFLLVTVSFIGFFDSAFAAPPTATDLNLRYDATNGTAKDGHLDSFKSSFGSYFF